MFPVSLYTLFLLTSVHNSPSPAAYLSVFSFLAFSMFALVSSILNVCVPNSVTISESPFAFCFLISFCLVVLILWPWRSCNGEGARLAIVKCGFECS